MIRKSKITDVYKYAPGDIMWLYDKLSQALGDSNPFAHISIGAGYYEWSDNRCEWKRMTDASEFRQDEVRDELQKIKQEVAEKVGRKTADYVFSTPDESYIYYNDEGEDIEVILTAWGFKNPKKTKLGEDGLPIETKNPVTISFIYDGELVPNYSFGIKTARQVKRLQTDINGHYIFSNLKVGERFILFDSDYVRQFILTIEGGQSEYQFDVTKYTTLYVRATRDGNPLCDESIWVSYNGREYEGVTNVNGEWTSRLPYFSDMSIEVKMLDEEKTVLALEDETYVNFTFDTPKESEIPEPEPGPEPDPYPYIEPNPEPEPESDTDPEPARKIRFRFVDVSGKPVVCENVIFRQQGQQDCVTTLSEGETYLEENLFNKDEPVTVDINGWNNEEQYSPVSFSLDYDEYEYVFQEMEPKHSKGSVLISVLAIVAFVVLLCLLWPYFEQLCEAVGNRIFNG